MRPVAVLCPVVAMVVCVGLLARGMYEMAVKRQRTLEPHSQNYWNAWLEIKRWPAGPQVQVGPKCLKERTLWPSDSPHSSSLLWLTLSSVMYPILLSLPCPLHNFLYRRPSFFPLSLLLGLFTNKKTHRSFSWGLFLQLSHAKEPLGLLGLWTRSRHGIVFHPLCLTMVVRCDKWCPMWGLSWCNTVQRTNLQRPEEGTRTSNFTSQEGDRGSCRITWNTFGKVAGYDYQSRGPLTSEC